MEAVVTAGALLDTRPSLARLSAELPYREVGNGDIATELLDLIDRLRTADETASVDRRHALGVSYLLAGKIKTAVDPSRRRSAARRTCPAAW
jgi:hypothetical protein